MWDFIIHNILKVGPSSHGVIRWGYPTRRRTEKNPHKDQLSVHLAGFAGFLEGHAAQATELFANPL